MTVPRTVRHMAFDDLMNAFLPPLVYDEALFWTIEAVACATFARATRDPDSKAVWAAMAYGYLYRARLIRADRGPRS